MSHPCLRPWICLSLSRSGSPESFYLSSHPLPASGGQDPGSPLCCCWRLSRIRKVQLRLGQGIFPVPDLRRRGALPPALGCLLSLRLKRYLQICPGLSGSPFSDPWCLPSLPLPVPPHLWRTASFPGLLTDPRCQIRFPGGRQPEIPERMRRGMKFRVMLPSLPVLRLRSWCRLPWPDRLLESLWLLAPGRRPPHVRGNFSQV